MKLYSVINTYKKECKVIKKYLGTFEDYSEAKETMSAFSLPVVNDGETFSLYEGRIYTVDLDAHKVVTEIIIPRDI